MFDLDGTLLDSDEALLSPFVALGVAREVVRFGHPLDEECARLGLSVTDYLACYDTGAAMPFPGVPEMLSKLGRWAVCSNKRKESGTVELARLGWLPEVAIFADTFAGLPKSLTPVLAAMGVSAGEVLFVGDTEHDRRCAHAAGCQFAMAGWNPRAVRHPDDIWLDEPADLLMKYLLRLGP